MLGGHGTPQHDCFNASERMVVERLSAKSRHWQDIFSWTGLEADIDRERTGRIRGLLAKYSKSDDLIATLNEERAARRGEQWKRIDALRKEKDRLLMLYSDKTRMDEQCTAKNKAMLLRNMVVDRYNASVGSALFRLSSQSRTVLGGDELLESTYFDYQAIVRDYPQTIAQIECFVVERGIDQLLLCMKRYLEKEIANRVSISVEEEGRRMAREFEGSTGRAPVTLQAAILRAIGSGQVSHQAAPATVAGPPSQVSTLKDEMDRYKGLSREADQTLAAGIDFAGVFERHRAALCVLESALERHHEAASLLLSEISRFQFGPRPAVCPPQSVCAQQLTRIVPESLISKYYPEGLLTCSELFALLLQKDEHDSTIDTESVAKAASSLSRELEVTEQLVAAAEVVGRVPLHKIKTYRDTISSSPHKQ